MNLFRESKNRSLIKAILFRILAILNCYVILALGFYDESPLLLTVLLNLTGFIIYYFYERAWNLFDVGRYEKK